MKLLRIKKLIFKHWPLLVLALVVVIFFWKFFVKSWLPIPADTIVGMYHPWRDIVWDGLTAGVPFKNFLITDPVRQQFPWRQLVIDLWQKGQSRGWNPYSFAGTPLLANFQSTVFYPLNILFFLTNTATGWGILIFIQPLLAGVFLYLYLRHLKLRPLSCLIGSLCWSFSGFFVAWLEWGTILHTILWLPLILLAIEKILKGIIGWRWPAVWLAAMVFSFFAGHLQVFFYLFLFSLVYLVWWGLEVKGDRRRIIFLFMVLYLLFAILTSVQWQPTWEFIRLSARGVDQVDWQKPGWFLPWQHLVQFLAPDFFGNPTTLNYWGEWNYGEFVGYIGVVGLLLTGLAIFYKRTRRATFFLVAGVVALSFALPTPWAKLPYLWRLPLVGTSQPTRLLVIVGFCLAVLAAFGAEALWQKKKRLKKPLVVLFSLYLFLWLLVFLAPRFWPQADWLVNLSVTKRNLILPTGIFLAGAMLVLITSIDRLRKVSLATLVVLMVFDLLRFGWKFTPFVKEDWLFPSTETIEFLQEDEEIFRIMTTDRRILPPNFNVFYRLETVSGYDPLYLRRYGELIAAMERGEPDISPPFGFNRIITPHNFESRLADLMNVKYVLSLTNLGSEKLELVFQEGQTRVYENKQVFPRAFMVFDYLVAEDKQEAINLLMESTIDLQEAVVLEENPGIDPQTPTVGQVEIESYWESQVVIKVESPAGGILVLTDVFYPGWRAMIDDQEKKIYRANYHFRAVVVPEGKHRIVFKYGN